MNRLFAYKNFNLTLLVSCLAFVVFALFGWQNLDPDFGWHYKMGEIIVTKGIPVTDSFTYTMPSYPFVDYEWLSNVFIFEIYSHFGKLVLACIYALIALYSLHIVIPHKYKRYTLFFLLIGISVFLPRAGVRPQVEAWLLFAVLIRMLFEKKLWLKYRYFFPLLMLAWVNLHGSYPIAFFIVGLAKFGEFLQTRKIDWKDILVVIFGIIATFINPYGLRDWQEVLHQMSQTSLFRETIEEWQPFYHRFELGLLMLSVMGGLLLWKYKAKVAWGWIIIFIATLYLAVSSIRHAPLFVLATAPIVCFCIYLLEEEVKKIYLGRERFFFVAKICCGIAFIIVVAELYLSSIGILNESNFYPADAVNFIKEQQIHDHIFSVYGWGGYLIWKLPEEKVFVDGRMSGFLWNAPAGESDSAFLDYLAITSKKDNWQETLNTYHVTYILWYADETVDDSSVTQILTKLLAIFGINDYQQKTPLVTQLKEVGWNEIYQDNQAVILKKE